MCRCTFKLFVFLLLAGLVVWFITQEEFDFPPKRATKNARLSTMNPKPASLQDVAVRMASRGKRLATLTIGREIVRVRRNTSTEINVQCRSTEKPRRKHSITIHSNLRRVKANIDPSSNFSVHVRMEYTFNFLKSLIKVMAEEGFHIALMFAMFSSKPTLVIHYKSYPLPQKVYLVENPALEDDLIKFESHSNLYGGPIDGDLLTELYPSNLEVRERDMDRVIWRLEVEIELVSQRLTLKSCVNDKVDCDIIYGESLQLVEKNPDELETIAIGSINLLRFIESGLTTVKSWCEISVSKDR